MHTFTWFNAFTLSQSDALITAQFSQVRERPCYSELNGSRKQTNIKEGKRMLPSWRICMFHRYKKSILNLDKGSYHFIEMFTHGYIKMHMETKTLLTHAFLQN